MDVVIEKISKEKELESLNEQQRGPQEENEEKEEKGGGVVDKTWTKERNDEFVRGASMRFTNDMERMVNDGEVDINAVDSQKKTALFYSGWSKSLVNFLISKGAKANIEDTEKNTPLFFVSDSEVAELFVVHNLDVNHKNAMSQRPIHVCSSNVMEVLVDNNAELNVRDSQNNTPFHGKINLKIFKKMAKKWKYGAEALNKFVGSENQEGDAPIHTIIKKSARDRNEIIEELVKNYKEDINRKQGGEDSEQMTPLHLAVKYKLYDTVGFLVKNKEKFGVDERIEDKVGRTPMQLAEEMNDPVLEDLLAGRIFLD
ncbi:hypothetical protein KJ855_03805 [Patescibacteria group bacterium]|nr:hypothetical protein [Patescibacteria group bacterium]